jgi:hypothetical protein
MVVTVLTVSGIVLAVAAAAAAVIGSAKAAPLVPSDAAKTSAMVHVIEQTLWALQKVVSRWREDREQPGPTTGQQLTAALTTMSETLEKWVPRIPKPYDFEADIRQSAGARLWLLGGGSLILLAGACQVIAALLPG